jgi:uncharacterized membrane protein
MRYISVTTSIGAESMRGDLPWNGFINDIETFVKSVQLYQDERLWLQAQKWYRNNQSSLCTNTI